MGFAQGRERDAMQVSSEVAAAFEEANRNLPGIAVTLMSFATRLEQNRVRAEDLKARGRDLLLACACAQGDQRALEYFEREYLSDVAGFARGVKLDASGIEEVTQRARVKLLAGIPPGIAGYRGRAALRAWVRVSVARLALNLAAEANRWEEVGGLDALAAFGDTPERAAERGLYRGRFQRALAAALQQLAPRQRTVLRLHAVDNLNVDGIGAIYGVHRATVARWLSAIRSQIFQDLRAGLGVRRPASSSEVWSLVELLPDEIQLTAQELLAAQPWNAAEPVPSVDS